MFWNLQLLIRVWEFQSSQELYMYNVIKDTWLKLHIYKLEFLFKLSHSVYVGCCLSSHHAMLDATTFVRAFQNLL